MKLQFLALSFSAFLAAPALAQFDTIYLTDGSKRDKARITKYTCKKLEFRERRLDESIPRERVFRIELGQTQVLRTFKDARKSTSDEDFATAYQRWLQAAEACEKKKNLATFAQFAYWEAFKLALKVGTPGDRKVCLDALEKTQEGMTAFWPEIWRYRLDKARVEAGNVRQKLEAYKAQVEKFQAFLVEKDMSTRYSIEGELYLLEARSLLREIDSKRLQDSLGRLLPRVEGAYPDLANRVNLKFAFAVLNSKRHDEARKLFSAIHLSRVADDVTKAKALVGRGHTWFRKTPRKAEDAKRALLDYMRVVVLYEEVDKEIVSEALFHAAEAYQVWNGPDSQTAVRRLRSRLKLKFAETSWAKK